MVVLDDPHLRGDGKIFAFVIDSAEVEVPMRKGKHPFAEHEFVCEALAPTEGAPRVFHANRIDLDESTLYMRHCTQDFVNDLGRILKVKMLIWVVGLNNTKSVGLIMVESLKMVSLGLSGIAHRAHPLRSYLVG